MEKRYQVFVSSTYEDLKEERLEVMKALLELDCIPCGMEYFPAANEDQWTYIRKLIDSCDYYVVIIGGCYGSEDENKISYTRKEYEYALSQGIPTIGFIINDREILATNKKDTDSNKIRKLDDFIGVVRTKPCKSWSSAQELGAVVSRSLTQLIKSTPRIGWIRADKAASEDLLREINELRKNNEKLKEEATTASKGNKVEITDIATLDEIWRAHGTYYGGNPTTKREWFVDIKWKDLFGLIAPQLLQNPNESSVEMITNNSLFELCKQAVYSAKYHYLDNQAFQTMKIQFMALGLVNIQYAAAVSGAMALFWSLTPEGKSLMFELRAIKKNEIKKIN